MPLLAVLAFSASCPTSASAQTTGTTTTTTTTSNQAIDSNLVVRRSGSTKPIQNGTLVFANIADCGGDGPDAPVNPTIFEFSVTYTTNVPVVEAWLGVGSSENCATQANRLRPSNNASLPPICTYLGSDTSNTRNPKILVPGNVMFNQNAGRANPSDTTDVSRIMCDPVNGGQTYTIYILPLQTPTTNVNGSDPIMVGALSTLKAVFTPYTQRPVAPSSLSGQSGETEIGLNFKAPSSSMTLTTYRGYFDVTGGVGTGIGGDTDIDAGLDAGSDATVGTPASSDAGVVTVADAPIGMDASTDAGTSTTDDEDDDDDAGSTTAPLTCGSGFLENNPIPNFNLPASSLRIVDSKSTAIKLQDLSGVPLGTNIAAAAVALDPAGNESRLSDPICVVRESTTGFIDACNNTPGCRDGFHSCSLSPGRDSNPWTLALLGLAVAALVRRRRRA